MLHCRDFFKWDAIKMRRDEERGDKRIRFKGNDEDGKETETDSEPAQKKQILRGNKKIWMTLNLKPAMIAMFMPGSV